MGTLRMDQGSFSLAEPLYRRALEGAERSFGRDHPYTLTSVGNLGELFFAQGELSLAEPFIRRALEGRERTLGSEHPHTRQSEKILRRLLEEIEKSSRR